MKNWSFIKILHKRHMVYVERWYAFDRGFEVYRGQQRGTTQGMAYCAAINIVSSKFATSSILMLVVP